MRGVVEYVEVKRSRILAGEKRNDRTKLALRMKLVKMFDVSIHLCTGFFALSTLESFLEPLNLEEQVFVRKF